MAFEQIGLGGILTFNDAQALSAMNRASIGVKSLQANMVRLRASVATVGAGFNTLFMAALPLAAAIGWGAKQAYNFEAQMSVVSAITQANAEDMTRLADKAKALGISTVYSATQAAQGLEVLGRAGFGVEGSLKAITGVLAAAAAEGIGMAESADIIANTLRGMNLQFEDSQRVADVLALTSMSTNTNISMLGESFSYAATMAATSGVPLEELSAAFGLIANTGIQASRGGTSMEAFMKGLLTMTPRAASAAQELGVSFRDDAGALLPLPDIIDNLSAALEGVEDPVRRDQLLFRLFRDQGSRAFKALQMQGTPALRELIASLEDAGGMTDQFGQRVGAAQAMASRRLDNLQGAMILLKSSLEGIGIALFTSFLRPMMEATIRGVNSLNSFLTTLNSLNSDPSLENVTALTGQYGETTVGMALGVREGLQTVKNTWSTVKGAVREAAEWIGMAFGEASARDVMKWVTAIGLLIPAVMALGAALKMLTFVGGGVVQIISGSAGIIAALVSMLPMLAVVGTAAGLAFLLIRNDGEAVGQTLTRIIEGVKQFALDAYSFMSAVLGPIIQAFAGIFLNNVIPVFAQFREFARMVFGDIASFISAVTLGSLPQWQVFSNAVAGVIRQIGYVFAQTFGGIISIASAVWGFIVNMVSQMRPGFESLMGIISSFMGYIGTVFQFVGQVVGFVAQAVVWLINEFSWLGEVIATVFNGAMEILRPIFDILYAIGSTALRFIWNVLQGIWAVLQPIFSIISFIGKTVWELLKPAFEAVKVVVVAIFDALKWIYDNAISPLIDAVGGALRAAFEAIGFVINGIKSALEWIVDKIKWVADKVASILGGMGVARDQINRMMNVAQTSDQLSQGTRAYAYTDPLASASSRQMGAPYLAQAAASAGAARAGATTPPQPGDMTATINDNRTMDITTNANIDGRCVSSAVARNQREVRERAGFEDTPWQRRAAVVRNQDLVPAA